MPFRFIDSTGRETTAESLASLLELVKQGTLGEETLVFDEQERRWRKAREITYLTLGQVPEPSQQTSATEVHLDEGEAVSAREEFAALDPIEVRPSLDPNFEADNPSVPPKVALREQKSAWRRWTDWLKDDGACLRVGISVLAISGLMLLFLIAGSEKSISAEKLGEALGRMLVTGAVIYFFLKRSWGRGRVVLVLACFLFIFFSYMIGIVALRNITNGRTATIMLSTIADVQQRSQNFAQEITALNIDSVFEMLEGKKACERADLLAMRERVGVADRKTAEFINFFEHRVDNAKNELAAIDPSSSSKFTSGVNKTFPSAKTALTLQRQYYAAIKDLLDFLLDLSGPFRVSNRGVSFDEDSDRLNYNNFIDRINVLAESFNKARANAK
jgi:hypothetical protein